MELPAGRLHHGHVLPLLARSCQRPMGVALGVGRCRRPGFSCKYTAVLFPPILAVAWWFDGRRQAEAQARARSEHDAPGCSWACRVTSWCMLAGQPRGHGFALMPLSQLAGRHPSIDGQVRASSARAWIARIYETSDPAGLGRLRHPDAPPEVGRAELSPGRAADDRLVVLLPRGAGREGAADLLAPARRPCRTGGAARGIGKSPPRDELLPLVIGPLPGDHGGSARRGTTGSVTSSARPAGDRLGLAPGREAGDARAAGIRLAAWIVGLALAGQASPWRASIPTS